MKEWEKRNAEEGIESLVGMSLHAIEANLERMSNRSLDQLIEHIEERYPRRGESFAEILHGLCLIEAASRMEKGGADE